MTAKIRKRIARLKREMSELEALGYKHDGNDGWGIAGDRLNDRYNDKFRELKKLTQPNDNYTNIIT